MDIFTAQPLEEKKEEEGGKGEEGQEKKNDANEKVNNKLDLNWVVEEIASTCNFFDWNYFFLLLKRAL